MVTRDPYYKPEDASRQAGMGTPMSGQKDTIELAQEKASQVGEQIQEKASQLVDQAQQQAKSQISMRKDQAAESLGTVAGALRQTGEQLRQQNQSPIATYADKAAEQVEQFSHYLREKEPGQLIGDVENFARRQPAIFLGGAFVLGLIGARFLKSSQERQQEQMQRSQPGYGYQGNYASSYVRPQPQQSYPQQSQTAYPRAYDQRFPQGTSGQMDYSASRSAGGDGNAGFERSVGEGFSRKERGMEER